MKSCPLHADIETKEPKYWATEAYHQCHSFGGHVQQRVGENLQGGGVHALHAGRFDCEIHGVQSLGSRGSHVPPHKFRQPALATMRKCRHYAAHEQPWGTEGSDAIFARAPPREAPDRQPTGVLQTWRRLFASRHVRHKNRSYTFPACLRYFLAMVALLGSSLGCNSLKANRLVAKIK